MLDSKQYTKRGQIKTLKHLSIARSDHIQISLNIQLTFNTAQYHLCLDCVRTVSKNEKNYLCVAFNKRVSLDLRTMFVIADPKGRIHIL